MTGLLLLLCCMEILVAPLYGALNASRYDTGVIVDVTEQYLGNISSAFQTKPGPHPATAASTTMSSQSATTVSHTDPPGPQPTNPQPTNPQPTNPQPTITLSMMFTLKECRPVLMLTGALIIACAILLVSTFLLACKVCYLSRLISADGDLISTSEYWVGNAKKNKSKSETEAKETSILMDDMSQTQEEMGNGTTKEEGGKLNEDGQTGEEKKTEDGNAGDKEEASSAPVAAAESSSSSRPQEDATNSQDTEAVSSGGKDEPKDVV